MGINYFKNQKKTLWEEDIHIQHQLKTTESPSQPHPRDILSTTTGILPLMEAIAAKLLHPPELLSELPPLLQFHFQPCSRTFTVHPTLTFRISAMVPIATNNLGYRTLMLTITTQCSTDSNKTWTPSTTLSKPKTLESRRSSPTVMLISLFKTFMAHPTPISKTFAMDQTATRCSSSLSEISN